MQGVFVGKAHFENNKTSFEDGDNVGIEIHYNSEKKSCSITFYLNGFPLTKKLDMFVDGNLYPSIILIEGSAMYSATITNGKITKILVK